MLVEVIYIILKKCKGVKEEQKLRHPNIATSTTASIVTLGTNELTCRTMTLCWDWKPNTKIQKRPRVR